AVAEIYIYPFLASFGLWIIHGKQFLLTSFLLIILSLSPYLFTGKDDIHLCFKKQKMNNSHGTHGHVIT
ncbi:hypothetical protein ACJX0J_039054, partial [Zea mays]